MVEIRDQESRISTMPSAGPAALMLEQALTPRSRRHGAGFGPARSVWPEVVALMRELDTDPFENKPIFAASSSQRALG
jgi:hypothetical protein